MLRIRTSVVAIAVALSLATASAACSETPESGDITKTSARKAAQRGALQVLPQISAAGGAPQGASKAKTALVATFKPAIKGRLVKIQRKQGSRWVTTAARAKQAKSTTLEFSVPYAVKGKPATYRAVASGVKKPAVATKPVRTDKHGAPDFSDEFSGSAIDATTWVTRVQGEKGYIPGRKCSKTDPRAQRVSGGTLRLSVMKDPDRAGQKCTYKGKKYNYRLSGHVATVDPNSGLATKSFKYGYFAARMKMHALRGQHSAFWMQTTMGGAGRAATHGTEIDIIEYFGNKHPQGGLTSFVYGDGKQTGGMLPKAKQHGRDWSKRFHVFSVEWTPKHYIFRIDGKETLRTSKAVSRVPEFMILSLLPSDWELPLMPSESKLPQTAQVDWVRHWKL